MTEQIDFDNLPEEDKQYFQREFARVEANFIQHKQEARMAKLIEQYKQEIYAIRHTPHKAPEVRAKYAALGVPVDRINFKV